MDRSLRFASDLGGRGWFARWSGDRRAELFLRPHGAAWLGEDLFVTDPGAGRLLRLSLRDRAIRSSSTLVSPIGVASCLSGVLVTDSATGEVWLFDQELVKPALVADGLSRPTGVACADETALVVETGRHRVVILPLDAERWPVRVSDDSESLGSRGNELGHFNFPTSVVVDDDAVWVGDTLNFRVQRLQRGAQPNAPDQESARSFGALGDRPGDLPRLKGLALDAQGRLWVSDAHLDQVALFSQDGTWLMSLGRRGTAAGEFQFPAGIACRSDGKVAVVDSLNRRIQLFDLVPTRSFDVL